MRVNRMDDINQVNDYEGSCENCHRHMLPEDKYCSYCGTPRGEGKFNPSENKFYCIYGPPIKEVYRCHACGRRWLSYNESSKYCPNCRLEKLDVRSGYLDDFISLSPSGELPSDFQFLSEDEARGLLKLRSDEDEEDIDTATRIREEDFTDWYKGLTREEELTEREAGRANLERLILTQATGSNPLAMNTECPVCHGKLIAGILYKSMDDDFKIRTVDIEYQDKEGDGVYCESGDILFYCDDSPKYRCLQCNHKFTDIHG